MYKVIIAECTTFKETIQNINKSCFCFFFPLLLNWIVASLDHSDSAEWLNRDMNI